MPRGPRAATSARRCGAPPAGPSSPRDGAEAQAGAPVPQGVDALDQLEADDVAGGDPPGQEGAVPQDQLVRADLEPVPGRHHHAERHGAGGHGRDDGPQGRVRRAEQQHAEGDRRQHGSEEEDRGRERDLGGGQVHGAASRRGGRRREAGPAVAEPVRAAVPTRSCRESTDDRERIHLRLSPGSKVPEVSGKASSALTKGVVPGPGLCADWRQHPHPRREAGDGPAHPPGDVRRGRRARVDDDGVIGAAVRDQHGQRARGAPGAPAGRPAPAAGHRRVHADAGGPARRGARSRDPRAAHAPGGRRGPGPRVRCPCSATAWRPPGPDGLSPPRARHRPAPRRPRR